MVSLFRNEFLVISQTKNKMSPFFFFFVVDMHYYFLDIEILLLIVLGNWKWLIKIHSIHEIWRKETTQMWFKHFESKQTKFRIIPKFE